MLGQVHWHRERSETAEAGWVKFMGIESEVRQQKPRSCPCRRREAGVQRCRSGHTRLGGFEPGNTRSFQSIRRTVRGCYTRPPRQCPPSLNRPALNLRVVVSL